VVIAIIAVLIELLISSVQAVRDAAAEPSATTKVITDLPCKPPDCETLAVDGTARYSTIPASWDGLSSNPKGSAANLYHPAGPTRTFSTSSTPLPCWDRQANT